VKEVIGNIVSGEMSEINVNAWRNNVINAKEMKANEEKYQTQSKHQCPYRVRLLVTVWQSAVNLQYP
jgi:hypothetical protein